MINMAKIVFARGDDCGSSHSANMAISEACETGILKNVSFMMPCRYAEEAASIFAGNENICHGLHATMNAEWDALRWGPVLVAEQVPSLVDPHGWFHQTPLLLKNSNVKIGEIMAETQAQLDKATRLGLRIRYAEMHMCFGWIIEDLETEFEQWCQRKGLINNNHLYPPLPLTQCQGDPVEMMMDRIRKAPPGCYTLVGHPAYDDSETRLLGHIGYSGDDVAIERNWERLVFCDPRIVSFFRDNDVISARYDHMANDKTVISG
jgi:chitin disaccharide deacetylase